MLRSVIKRGFSYDETQAMPLPFFRSLELFDRFIEPSGIDVIDAMFARLHSTIYAASGHMSKEGLRKMKSSDFKLIRDETIFKSPEEIQKEKELKAKKKENEILQHLSPAEREKYLKRKGVKNGKR